MSHFHFNFSLSHSHSLAFSTKDRGEGGHRRKKVTQNEAGKRREKKLYSALCLLSPSSFVICYRLFDWRSFTHSHTHSGDIFSFLTLVNIKDGTGTLLATQFFPLFCLVCCCCCCCRCCCYIYTYVCVCISRIFLLL